MIGTRIGPYEVVAKLGEGGMGVVYRARDTKLNRDVAIKVLPASFAHDAERLARFTREAQTLAALNHPNIAHLHGLEERDGTTALVMEFVDGPTLEEMIRAKGPGSRAQAGTQPAGTSEPLGPGPLALGLIEVLSIARQMADALETAHEQGIVHRDLKPANVKVRPDGTVKVLDFGLAKALGPASASAPSELANSPTMTGHATERGVILGTAAYMSPEQARGKIVDKRADIWAFGVVLYEMLTGTRAFDGAGFPDVLAAVVRHEIDWSRVPADTPPRLRQLLTRCLQPDVKQRLRDIGEARVAIGEIEKTPAVVPPTEPMERLRVSSHRLPWTVAALAVLAAAAIVVWQRMALTGGPSGAPGAANEVNRLSVLPPLGFAMNPDSTNVAISPNGRMVAFIVGTGVSTENQLWVRPLDAAVARRIEGGDGVAQPFWSPDSERIGFFANRKLKTVAAAGGAATVVCDAPFGRGATWNSSNVIVFALDSTGPLYRVSAGGNGPATPLTALDAARKETGHRFPVFLPDGDHFLFAALPGVDGVYTIFASTLRDPLTRTVIGTMESAPVYASDPSTHGWLLFTRQGVAAAQPFDAETLRFTGDAVSLGDEPAVAPGSAAYEAGRRISVSATGSFAYYLEPSTNTNVQWMDQTGKTTGTVSVPAGRYTAVAIAPNNTKAVLVRSDSLTTWSLWVADLTRASAVPLLTGVSKNPSPVWSPDSTRIVYASERSVDHGLYEKNVATGVPERLILRVDNSSAVPRSWSKDEQWILFSRVDPGTKWNIFRVPASGSGAPVPVVEGPAIEVLGSLSPDNHWLAYLSDEAGHLDLYVQSFPDGRFKTQVVAAGGIQQSWWTPDGAHLLYLKRDESLWRVGVDLRAGPPRIETPVQLATFPSSLVAMDLAPDGRQFLALVPERAGLGTVTIVQSWRAALPASLR